MSKNSLIEDDLEKVKFDSKIKVTNLKTNEVKIYEGRIIQNTGSNVISITNGKENVWSSSLNNFLLEKV